MSDEENNLETENQKRSIDELRGKLEGSKQNGVIEKTARRSGNETNYDVSIAGKQTESVDITSDGTLKTTGDVKEALEKGNVTEIAQENKDKLIADAYLLMKEKYPDMDNDKVFALVKNSVEAKTQTPQANEVSGQEIANEAKEAKETEGKGDASKEKGKEKEPNPMQDAMDKVMNPLAARNKDRGGRDDGPPPFSGF